MVPRPQLSLCISVSRTSDLIQEFSDNVSHFFRKFPLLYEVLFAVNPRQDQGLPLLHYLAERNPQFRIVENSASLTRAENLENLFHRARGNILITTDLELALPLSEVLKIFETLHTEQDVEAVFGHRNNKVKKNLENFFQQVIHDKTRWPFRDPFCPVLGLRKESFLKIQNELKSKGWYWTHEVQRAVHVKSLKSREIPLYVGSRQAPSLYGRAAVVEALRLFKFVLLRI